MIPSEFDGPEISSTWFDVAVFAAVLLAHAGIIAAIIWNGITPY